MIDDSVVETEADTSPVAQEASDSPNTSPLAVVGGEPVLAWPKDLYIPPDALEIFIEAFEGPLDLLLYLIKKQNLDILILKVAPITQQYIEYINLMQSLRIDLAAEYLVMAATLTEIKSRLLLPKTPTEEAEEEGDPRLELIRRLQAYEQIKVAAERLDVLPRMERDLQLGQAALPPIDKAAKPLPTVNLQDLCFTFVKIMDRAQKLAKYTVMGETITLRERMTEILDNVSTENYIAFDQLFKLEEGRLGIVVTFTAILELLKQRVIEIVQNEIYSPIHIKGIAA